MRQKYYNVAFGLFTHGPLVYLGIVWTRKLRKKNNFRPFGNNLMKKVCRFEYAKNCLIVLKTNGL